MKSKRSGRRVAEIARRNRPGDRKSATGQIDRQRAGGRGCFEIEFQCYGEDRQEELEEFFILSDLTIEQAKEASASVTKTRYAKCARCWRHRAYVGKSKAHPDLCDRCEGVITRRRQNGQARHEIHFFSLAAPLSARSSDQELVLLTISARRTACGYPRIFSTLFTSRTPARPSVRSRTTTLFSSGSLSWRLLFVLILLLRRDRTTGQMARCFARAAACRRSGKSDRSSALRARDRFSTFRSACSVRASLASFQCS